ncbi:MAG TPA: BPL-N domain-containing protein, partial [Alphaproteobacteria bacterium]
MRKNTIVLYADRASHASVTGLAAEFARALGPLAAMIDIVETDAAALRSGTAIDDRTLAFVLPGIVGENSLYHAHIGAEGNDAIRRYVQEGGVFMGLCAGAYYAAQSIEYAPEWAPPRGRNEG